MLIATTIATAGHSAKPTMHNSAPLSVVQAAVPSGNSITRQPQAQLSVTQTAAPSASAGQLFTGQSARSGPSQLPGKPAGAASGRPQAASGWPQNPAQGPSQNTQQQPASQPAAPPPPPTYSYTGNAQTDLVTIARYLVDEGGYSAAGAAGVVGCIQGESGTSPEATQGSAAGGAGLIQWTPEASISQYGGSYGGNPQADFSSQLGAIVRYNSANGDVAALNASTDPVAAADYYSQHFERPAVLNSDVRPGNAIAVYGALTRR
jgi:hypothetical protein